MIADRQVIVTKAASILTGRSNSIRPIGSSGTGWARSIPMVGITPNFNRETSAFYAGSDLILAECFILMFRTLVPTFSLELS